MGGQKKMSEPGSIAELLQQREVADIFRDAGWLPFLQLFEGHNKELAEEFAGRLRENRAVLRGATIQVTPKTISQISQIPCEGLKFYGTRSPLQEMFRVFAVEGDPEPTFEVNAKNVYKGVKRTSLPPPWDAVALWLMRYFTCEGQFAVLTGPHLKVLIHLRHGASRPELRINLPHFLHSSLHAMAKKIQEGTGPLKHHGLIMMICRHHFLRLEDGQQQWRVFLDNKLRAFIRMKRAANPATQRTPASDNSGKRAQGKIKSNIKEEEAEPKSIPEASSARKRRRENCNVAQESIPAMSSTRKGKRKIAKDDSEKLETLDGPSQGNVPERRQETAAEDANKRWEESRDCDKLTLEGARTIIAAQSAIIAVQSDKLEATRKLLQDRDSQIAQISQEFAEFKRKASIRDWRALPWKKITRLKNPEAQQLLPSCEK